MKETVMVSVLTTAYNHAPYIAQALDSFLMQKTDFKFEVIVHDDASTDGTADIIRQYAEKYPEIIKPIFQTENQYSQGNSPYDYMDPYIRGKYIAICEGDDYWCDENKLQKQVDYMEAHPECSACYCNSFDVDVNGTVIRNNCAVDSDRILTVEEIFSAEGDFFATAGLLSRVGVLSESLVSKFVGIKLMDVHIMCLFAMCGTIFCFQDKMVCYRRFVPGSWTMTVEKGHDIEEKVYLCEQMLSFYKTLLSLCPEYSPVIVQKIDRWEFKFLCETSQWKALQQAKYVDKYKKLVRSQRMIIFLKSHYPHAVKVFRFLRYGKEGLKKKY